MPAPLGHFAVAYQVARSLSKSRNHKHCSKDRTIHCFGASDKRDQFAESGDVYRRSGWQQHGGGRYYYMVGDASAYENLNLFSRYYFMGAVGPDLPYMHDVDLDGALHHVPIIGYPFFRDAIIGESKFADLFHYNKQSEFILKLIIESKKAKKAASERLLHYALGHATHQAADSMAHPYVNLFAGKYHKQTIKDIHRTAEMHQDAYLADKYFKTNIRLPRWLSWRFLIPSSHRTEYEYNRRYRQIDPIPPRPKELEEVLSHIGAAFRNTYGYGPDPEFLYDSYFNFDCMGIGLGYDHGTGGPPKTPHVALVQHRKVNRRMDYLKDVILGKAYRAARDACAAIIDLYQSSCSEEDQNRFRERVLNWNMDTGYWIDASCRGNEIRVVWRHRWCRPEKKQDGLGTQVDKPVARSGQVTIDSNLQVLLGMEVHQSTFGSNVDGSFWRADSKASEEKPWEKNWDEFPIEKTSDLKQENELFLLRITPDMIRGKLVRALASKPNTLKTYDDKGATDYHGGRVWATEEMFAKIDLFLDDKCLTGSDGTFDASVKQMKKTTPGVNRIAIRVSMKQKGQESKGTEPPKQDKKGLILKDFVVDGVVFVKDGQVKVRTDGAKRIERLMGDFPSPSGDEGRYA